MNDSTVALEGDSIMIVVLTANDDEPLTVSIVMVQVEPRDNGCQGLAQNHAKVQAHSLYLSYIFIVYM